MVYVCSRLVVWQINEYAKTVPNKYRRDWAIVIEISYIKNEDGVQGILIGSCLKRLVETVAKPEEHLNLRAY